MSRSDGDGGSGGGSDAGSGPGSGAAAPRISERAADQLLVERVQAGDQRAFDLLVLKYQQRICNLISRYVREPADVLDVAQETFIKAYRALPRFRGDSAFYTWIYRIAINTAKNHLSAQSRRNTDAHVDVEGAEQLDIGSELREQATPERLAMRDQLQSTVIGAMEALPEDLRVAITLREVEGMAYEEIAQAMECPIGTVRSRIFRAREAINRAMAPLLD